MKLTFSQAKLRANCGKFFFSAKTAVEFRNLKISKILNNIPNGIFLVPFKVMYISLWCT